MGGCNDVDNGAKPANEKKPEPSGQPAPANKDEITITSAEFSTPEAKILTLGAGECGKSTIWRQLKLIYCGGFDESERSTMKDVIRLNVISDIKTILEALSRSEQPVNQSLQSSVELITELANSEEDLTPEVAQNITKLWADPVIKHVFKQSNSIGLGDNAGFFLDEVERIAQSDYTPTDEDILKSRIRTVGISNLDFQFNNILTQLVDVGGQKSERARWQKCFTNVDFLLFVVSLSDFDQFMFEEEGTSRTQDSMALFNQIANSNIFESKPIFLVLNKKDLFEKKLQENPDKFREAYPGFSGDISSPEACIEHVKESFLKGLQERNADAWVETIPTCAMNQDSIRSLFQQIGKKVVQAKAGSQ